MSRPWWVVTCTGHGTWTAAASAVTTSCSGTSRVFIHIAAATSTQRDGRDGRQRRAAIRRRPPPERRVRHVGRVGHVGHRSASSVMAGAAVMSDCTAGAGRPPRRRAAPRSRRLPRLDAHRTLPPIAAGRHRLDVARVARLVGQHPPQLRDDAGERGIGDGGVGPQRVEDLLLAEEVPGPAHQQRQQIQGLGLEREHRRPHARDGSDPDPAGSRPTRKHQAFVPPFTPSAPSSEKPRRFVSRASRRRTRLEPHRHSHGRMPGSNRLRRAAPVLCRWRARGLRPRSPAPHRCHLTGRTAPLAIEMDGGIVVGVRIQGAGPFRFRLDTGASRTVVSRELAARLGLPLSGSSVVVTPAGRTVRPLTTVDDLTAGCLLGRRPACGRGAGGGPRSQRPDRWPHRAGRAVRARLHAGLRACRAALSRDQRRSGEWGAAAADGDRWPGARVVTAVARRAASGAGQRRRSARAVHPARAPAERVSSRRSRPCARGPSPGSGWRDACWCRRSRSARLASAITRAC